MLIRKISVQEWIPIEEIYKNGIIKINKNKYLKILKISPINYNLKSDLEKKTILNSYKIFLKTCNFNFQILIQSNKKDLSKHISNVQQNIHKKQNKHLKKLSESYINYINELNNYKKSSIKEYYLIISNSKNSEINSNYFDLIENDLNEKYFKIKECLTRCGNDVIEINNKNLVINILFSFLSTRKNFMKI